MFSLFFYKKIIDTFVSVVNRYVMNRYLLIICFLSWTSMSSFSQNFTDSNLPIIMITTDGGEIHDSYRVLADMKIIYRGEGFKKLHDGSEYTSISEL